MSLIRREIWYLILTRGHRGFSYGFRRGFSWSLMILFWGFIFYLCYKFTLP